MYILSQHQHSQHLHEVQQRINMISHRGLIEGGVMIDDDDELDLLDR